MPLTHSLFCILLATLAFTCPMPCQAEAPAYVTIPIYYLTDRQATAEGFASRRRYATHCRHQMYYGTAFINVKNTRRETPNESLGWQASGDRPQKFSRKDRITPAPSDAAKQAFMDLLKSALDRSGQNNLCVYVHGAEDAFEDCCQDAADLAYALKEPVVLYSWPSDPKSRGYFIDSSNNEWSQEHFNMFCRDLIALQSTRPFKVDLVAHSMGNRIVIRSLPVVHGKGLIANCELVSPDIDADICRHYVMDYPHFGGKLRLYVSNRDKMLAISQMLAGGYYRLGEAADPENRPEVSGDDFERIDFTTLDTGFTGHSIPFDLIASMIHTDAPGPGLQLVSEDAVRPNALARFAGRSQHMRSISRESSTNSKRVVKIGSN